jgi:hypothetical protein
MGIDKTVKSEINVLKGSKYSVFTHTQCVGDVAKLAAIRIHSSEDCHHLSHPHILAEKMARESQKNVVYLG